MASVLGVNLFPLCSSGQWFFSPLRYCPVFTHLCQCHWISSLPPSLIPHHVYTNLVLCLLPQAPERPVGVASFREQNRHQPSEKSQGTVILHFCPEQGLGGCVGNQGRSFIRAIQSMQTSKSPQPSPAVRARGAVSYPGFMHYAGSGACSLIRGNGEVKAQETAQEGCCEVNICLLFCSYLRFQGSPFCLTKTQKLKMSSFVFDSKVRPYGKQKCKE